MSAGSQRTCRTLLYRGTRWPRRRSARFLRSTVMKYSDVLMSCMAFTVCDHRKGPRLLRAEETVLTPAMMHWVTILELLDTACLPD